MADFAAIRFQPSRPLLRELSADRLNSILAEIRRNKPLPGRGVTVRQTGQGTAIDLAASTGRGGTSTPATPQPWDLIARVDPDADPEDETPDYLVTVRPGTLNSFLATNWQIEETLSSDGTLYYAKAVITTDGEFITEVSIAIDDQPPTTQTPQEFGVELEVQYLFGLFAAGLTYRTIGAGHITLAPATWLTKATDTPVAAGELPWVRYYRLQ